MSLQGIKAEHDWDLNTKGIHIKVGFKSRELMVMDHRNEVSWQVLVSWDEYKERLRWIQLEEYIQLTNTKGPNARDNGLAWTTDF